MHPSLRVKLAFGNIDDLWAFIIAATANFILVDIKNLVLDCDFTKADTALAIKSYNADPLMSVITD